MLGACNEMRKRAKDALEADGVEFTNGGELGVKLRKAEGPLRFHKRDNRSLNSTCRAQSVYAIISIPLI
jgi:hypothetical protein